MKRIKPPLNAVILFIGVDEAQLTFKRAPLFTLNLLARHKAEAGDSYKSRRMLRASSIMMIMKCIYSYLRGGSKLCTWMQLLKNVGNTAVLFKILTHIPKSHKNIPK